MGKVDTQFRHELPIATVETMVRLPPSMIPVGYMAKRVYKKPEWLQAPEVEDVFSVSNCVSEDFADYIEYSKHNGYWLFNSPQIIRTAAKEHSVDIEGTSLFYFEAYELEFDEGSWHPYGPEQSFTTDVKLPASKRLEGFDVVTFFAGTSPEHSPLFLQFTSKRTSHEQPLLVSVV